jgi:hypothetical protein
MQLIPDATKTVILQPYIGVGQDLIPSSGRNLGIVLKHQKYSKKSKIFRKIPRDTLGHEKSK